jgi:branched-subunit amino acid aminotransferase/4-amino-4-deoxychorismate lyase
VRFQVFGPGGTGVAKTGGNYAASLRASSAAAARGHHVVLWLDAPEHRYVQELSGMNLFAVIDGELTQLRERIDLKIHPGALTVVMPAAAGAASAPAGRRWRR